MKASAACEKQAKAIWKDRDRIGGETRAEGHRSGVKNCSRQRSERQQLSQHLRPRTHLGLRPREQDEQLMALPRHPLAVSFSRATKCGGAEAGEGYTEGCNYLFCSAQTSLTFASYQNSDPEKHIKSQRGRKTGAADTQDCFIQVKVWKNLDLPVALRRGSRLRETKQRDSTVV